ncbi:MAG: alpha/beta hydrolase [Bacillaceae bacterium]|nr:alpha/beta hydrolase [Bacillaceae bacterium]
MHERDQKLKLSDGRVLGFREYGHPDGQTIFFFHGTPNSRVFRYPDEQVARQYGLRFLHVDRPGYGLSDPNPGRSLLDWADDINELANQLSLNSFFIMGISGGGPHALACAYQLHARVLGVTLISNYLSINTNPRLTEGMSLYNRIGFWMAKNIPFLLKPALRSLEKGIKKDKEKQLNQMMKSFAAPDQQIVKRADVKSMYLEEMEEIYRKGIHGHFDDMVAVEKPWEFKLSDVTSQVHIWQGTEDRNSTVAMAKHAQENLPNSELHILEGEGHLLFFNHWQTIIRKMMEVKQ